MEGAVVMEDVVLGVGGDTFLGKEKYEVYWLEM